MKKITLVSLASCLFMFLCSGVAYASEWLAFPEAWVPLVIGVGILALSAVLVFTVRRTGMNIVCFLLSSIAMGFLIRAWYINRGFHNPLYVMLLVSLSTVVYLWVYFALGRIFCYGKGKEWWLGLTLIYMVLSGALYLLVMLNTKTTYVSTFGYYMLIEMAFIYAMSLEASTGEDLIRNLTYSTFSVFGVAVIVGVFVLIAAGGGDVDCDCDCGDACECCDCFSGVGDYNATSSTKRKNRK